MLQFVKSLIFQHNEIIKVFKDEEQRSLWLIGDRRLMYVHEAGRLLWQEQFEQRIMDASIATALPNQQSAQLLLLTEKGRIHLRSRRGEKIHNLFLGDSVCVAHTSNGEHFAVATEQAQIKFYTANGQDGGQFYLEHPIDHLCFCPWDTQSLIASDQSGKISAVHMQRGLLWTLDFERRLGRPHLKGRPAEIYLPFYADGLQVCSPFGKVLRGYALQDSLQGVDLSGDGSRLLLHNQDQQLCLYGQNGLPLWPVDGGERFVSAVLYKDGKSIVAVDRQGAVLKYRQNESSNVASFLEFPNDGEVKS